MNLEAVRDLVEAAGLAVSGTDLFISMMPAEAQKAVLLRDTFAGTKIDHELPGYYKTEFILVCRGPDYLTARALADDVVEAITIKSNTVVGEVTFRYSRPQTKPIPFPVSEGGLWEFYVRFDCCYEETP